MPLAAVYSSSDGQDHVTGEVQTKISSLEESVAVVLPTKNVIEHERLPIVLQTKNIPPARHNNKACGKSLAMSSANQNTLTWTSICNVPISYDTYDSKKTLPVVSLQQYFA